MKAMVGLIALVCAAATRPAAAEEPVWRPVPIPGGVAGLARAAQLGDSVEPWRVLYEASQRLHPTYGDPSEAARLRKEVRTQLQDEAPRVSRATVSLPLPPHLWLTAVLDEQTSESRLVEAILGRRDASLVYRGLFQMDDEGLRFLGQRPDLLKWIRKQRAEVFSLFARSLRFQGGRVVIPGGPAAERAWADLLDESPTRADELVRKLLTRDEGRALFLWDTLGRLEPGARRFALGGTEGDTRAASEALRRLASAFARGPAWWRPEGGAFVRPLVDPATVLGEVKVEPDGRLAPPASRAFWDSTLTGEVPGRADGLLSGPDVDATWLVDNVGLAPTPEQRRERLSAIAFAQRVFAGVTTATAPDVLLTLRGLARRPALVLVLDRMEVETPATYAQAVRRADEVAALGNGRRGVRALVQFQGALALLDRARFARTLDVAQAEALVRSLTAVPVGKEGYDGGIARWAEESLLPALLPLVDPDPESASADGTLLAALAGDRLNAPRGSPFEWEGLWYRAEPAVGERRRLAAIRERQGGNRVEAVLSFARAVRELRDRPLSESLAPLRESARSLDASGLSPDEQRQLSALASGALQRIDGLVQVADALLGEELLALAYAPHLGSAQGAAVAGASVAARHEFGSAAWEVPEEVLGTGAPWHVRGSLLGLDLALARLSLRQWSADMPSHPPGLDPKGALAFARTVVRSPYALRDEEAKAIAEAITRGHERAAAATDDSAAFARDAGLAAWRTQGLRATLRDDPRAAGRFFTLAELLRLGHLPGPPPDAWGTPDLARGGSLRFLWPLRIGYEDLAGQRLDELHAARLPDLVLRVAIELDARGLPARLVPGVLSLFVHDFVQDAAPIAHDDGLALARYARDVPSERFDEYVSVLAGDGTLVPASEPGEAVRP